MCYCSQNEQNALACLGRGYAWTGKGKGWERSKSLLKQVCVEEKGQGENGKGRGMIEQGTVKKSMKDGI